MTAAITKYPVLISGEKVYTDKIINVYDKYTNELIAEICAADEVLVNRAVAEAKHAFETTYFDVQTRYNVLMKAAHIMTERCDELADILTGEAGKIPADAKNEVLWTIDLIMDSAEEAKRINGETVCFPVPWLDTRTCYTRREPVGVVAAITPFNFPLNLVAHKVAPALAAGNAVVLKPAAVTPIIAYKFCEILIEAGLPRGFIHYLGGSGEEVGNALVANKDINFYSFTGSVPVGSSIKEKIGMRRGAFELGSNSATVICEDYDPIKAADMCAGDAFANAGQVCISLQRIYVQRPIFDAFLKRLVENAKAKIAGDPRKPGTDLGPVISGKDASRIIEWIEEAVRDGAVVHCGNKREGNVVWPTVLTNVNRDMKVIKDEVFGPVVSVIPFDTVDEAIGMVNDSRFGLNAGILTNNISVAMEAIPKIKTGGVIVGGTCSFRFGNMPYGGVKDSGIGREAPRYAIEEMTDLKTVVIL